MADDNALATATETQSDQQDDGKRERSTIQFPYLPLDEAVTIAKGIHEVGGTNCQIDQLAGHLNQSPASSMFKLRVSTARIFGLITNAHGTVTLTPLGTRICDPHQEQAAKAESFLAVPLYKQIYEQFKGASLPPANGLETTMVNLGVAQKQKSNARQVFQRAATQAGFFSFGPTRLVYPPIKGSAGTATATDSSVGQADDSTTEKPNKTKGGGGSGGGKSELHPFIQGLIATLPEPKTEWPVESRKKWLQAASNIFDLIYETGDDSRGSLKIEIQKDSAK